MNKNAKLAVNLAGFAVGMVMLAYASVPLYKIFCSATGYGGTTQEGKAAPGKVSKRIVNITFNADINPGLNWKFAPGETSHPVHVGEQALTFFTAENLENTPITGRAVYNVVPFKAGSYFTKIQCFCFSQQTLQAGQKVNMPVSFYLDPAMLDDPEMDDVKTITLSYTFFKVEKEQRKSK